MVGGLVRAGARVPVGGIDELVRGDVGREFVFIELFGVGLRVAHGNDGTHLEIG